MLQQQPPRVAPAAMVAIPVPRRLAQLSALLQCFRGSTQQGPVPAADGCTMQAMPGLGVVPQGWACQVDLKGDSMQEVGSGHCKSTTSG